MSANRLAAGQTVSGYPHMWDYYESEPSSPSESLYTLEAIAGMLEAEAERLRGLTSKNASVANAREAEAYALERAARYLRQRREP